jgi:hypothetical protein
MAQDKSSRNGVSVFDFAPTIAALHGVGRHKNWRGAVFVGLSQPLAGETAAV